MAVHRGSVAAGPGRPDRPRPIGASHVAGLAQEQVHAVRVVQLRVPLSFPDRPGACRQSGHLRWIGVPRDPQHRVAGNVDVSGDEPVAVRSRRRLHRRRSEIPAAARIGGRADPRQRLQHLVPREREQHGRVHAGHQRACVGVVRHGEPRLQGRHDDGDGDVREQPPSGAEHQLRCAEWHSDERDVLRNAGALGRSAPSEHGRVRAGSVDVEPPDRERRTAPRLVPLRLPGSERRSNAVRAGGALVPWRGSGELEGSEPAARHFLRPLRERKDGRQGEHQSLPDR